MGEKARLRAEVEQLRADHVEACEGWSDAASQGLAAKRELDKMEEDLYAASERIENLEMELLATQSGAAGLRRELHAANTRLESEGLVVRPCKHVITYDDDSESQCGEQALPGCEVCFECFWATKGE